MSNSILVKSKVVNTDWRDQPATYKQLLAINNAMLAGKLTRKRVSLPLTKGEAYDIIKKGTEATG